MKNELKKVLKKRVSILKKIRAKHFADTDSFTLIQTHVELQKARAENVRVTKIVVAGSGNVHTIFDLLLALEDDRQEIDDALFMAEIEYNRRID